MNYNDTFKEILFHITSEERTKNQILSELHLFSEQINEELRVLNIGYERLLGSISSDTLKSNELLRAIEYNNALLFAMLQPSNLIELLNKVVLEERYYFFFTVADILLKSELKQNTRNELKNLVNVFRHKLSLPQLNFNYTELKALQLIAQQILDSALGNYDSWQISIKKIIKDLIGGEKIDLSEFRKKIQFDDIINLRNQLELKL